jgi:hypothetical protein
MCVTANPVTADDHNVAWHSITTYLPLNFHPAAVIFSTDVTPFGAVSVPHRRPAFCNRASRCCRLSKIPYSSESNRPPDPINTGQKFKRLQWECATRPLTRVDAVGKRTLRAQIVVQIQSHGKARLVICRRKSLPRFLIPAL